MGLDQLLELTSSVAYKILPIAGVIVLVYLIIFVKHLVILLKNANTAVSTMAQTLDTTNRQLEALDKPLQTLHELSDTVDSVHEASKNVVRSTLLIIFENFSTIKDWVFHTMNKDKPSYEEDEDADNEGESIQDDGIKK